ncbi:DUF1801 domain-containing protein [Patescibacteria group bacterium]|nr:DUF1801 domain-containing protein [Patescibacteria group bacterium]
MPEQKTKPTPQSVTQFLNQVEDEQKREDSFELVEMMEKVTGQKPVMWGASIVGFGQYHYKYASGHEGDSCLTGFSPRKQSISVYITAGFEESQDLLKKLGKYKTSVGCLYIKKLADVDRAVLEKLIERSVKTLKERYS